LYRKRLLVSSASRSGSDMVSMLSAWKKCVAKLAKQYQLLRGS
jgi:hypothetical protein